jgi:hypothetical protein
MTPTPTAPRTAADPTQPHPTSTVRLCYGWPGGSDFCVLDDNRDEHQDAHRERARRVDDQPEDEHDDRQTEVGPGQLLPLGDTRSCFPNPASSSDNPWSSPMSASSITVVRAVQPWSAQRAVAYPYRGAPSFSATPLGLIAATRRTISSAARHANSHAPNRTNGPVIEVPTAGLDP